MKKPSKTVKTTNAWGEICQYVKDPLKLDNEMRSWADEINSHYSTKHLVIKLENHTFHYDLEPHFEPVEYDYDKRLDLESSFVMVCNGTYDAYDSNPEVYAPSEATFRPTKKACESFAQKIANICKQSLISVTIN